MSTIPPQSNQGSVELTQELHQALRVFFVDEQAIDEVAKKKEATLIGTVILCAPILIKIMIVFLMLGSFRSPHYGDMIGAFIAGVIALFAPFYIGRGLFGGKGDIEEFYRVMTYARIPHVFTVILAIVPALLVLGRFADFLVDVWMLWVAHIVLMKVMKLNELDSFKTVGLTLLAYMVLSSFLQLLF